MNFLKKSIILLVFILLCVTIIPCTAVLADGESQNVVSEVEQNANQNEDGITVGSVLVYIFVGLAGIGGVSYVIIAVKRKNKRPAGSHMPKASNKYREDD